MTASAPERHRITRDDFPVPPELADRDLAGAPGEHVGGLRAELRWRDGKLTFGKTYCQQPLRVYEPLTPHTGDAGLLYLINSTAGLLDGDGQLVALDVGAGVRAVVTNQSASRIHPCPTAHATARYDLRVAAGAVLCALPGPTIPFAGSRFYQLAEIALEPGSNVVWGGLIDE